MVFEHFRIEQIELRGVDVLLDHAFFEVVEADRARRAAEIRNRPLVQLAPDLGRRSPNGSVSNRQLTFGSSPRSFRQSLDGIVGAGIAVVLDEVLVDRRTVPLRRPIAAIGVVGGTLYSQCQSPHRLSVLMINGTDDRIIPPAGGYSISLYLAGQLRSVSDVIDYWSVVNRCDVTVVTRNDSVFTRVARCEGRRTVMSMLMSGLGHEWPTEARFRSASITQSIADFFRKAPAACLRCFMEGHRP